MSRGRQRYASISLPMGIVKEIDWLIDELRYWPSRGSFVREACLEKIREEQKRLMDLREASKEQGELGGGNTGA